MKNKKETTCIEDVLSEDIYCLIPTFKALCEIHDKAVFSTDGKDEDADQYAQAMSEAESEIIRGISWTLRDSIKAKFLIARI